VGPAPARPTPPPQKASRRSSTRARPSRFVSTVELVTALDQDKPLGTAGQIAERVVRSDLVILDELAFLPFGAAPDRSHDCQPSRAFRHDADLTFDTGPLSRSAVAAGLAAGMPSPSPPPPHAS
jgi:hypothetical protein